MKSINPSKKGSLNFLAVISLSILLSGCGPFVTLYANQQRFDDINDTSRPLASDDAFLVDAADRFGLMALFAEVVYRRDLDPSSRDGYGCKYLGDKQDNGGSLRYGMPSQADGKGGWTRWVPTPPLGAASPCFDESGLYYETYIHEDATGKITEAVISFRGTENRKSQYLYDWGTNFAAALGFEPKQYELASKYIPLVIQGLKARFLADGRETQIYATGHSLGGGLAQQAGYLSKDIKAIYTFNTTPVTNWSFLRTRGAVRNGYPIIYRIYHGGEVLEKVRFVSTSLTKARYGRHDIGLQFEGRSGFSGHSMQIIACNFARIISLRRPVRDASHNYRVQYILDQVLDEREIAQAGIRICPKQKVLE